MLKYLHFGQEMFGSAPTFDVYVVTFAENGVKTWRCDVKTDYMSKQHPDIMHEM